MTERGDLDGTIDELVELEQELEAGVGTTGSYEEGTIAGASKVPAEAVPDDYPLALFTDHALELDVDVPDGATVQTFVPWPEPGARTDHLQRLLDALGRDADEFADIYGDRVALNEESGWHVVDVEGTAVLDQDTFDGFTGDTSSGTSTSRTSSRRPARRGDTALGGAFWGVVATTTVVALGTAASTVGIVGTLLLLGGLLSTLALPAAIYLDTRDLPTSVDWEPRTAAWVLGGLVWPFNVGVGTAYALRRWLRSWDRPPRDAWAYVVTGSLVLWLFVLADLQIELLPSTSFLVVVALPAVLLPLGVYFDAATLRDRADWDPTPALWGIASAVWFLGWLVAAGYLALRTASVE